MERNTKIWRLMVGGFHTIIIGLLLYILEQGTHFVAATFSHWDKQEKRIDALTLIVSNHLAKDSNDVSDFKNRVIQNSSAIDFHTGQLAAIQNQTNANTASITSINQTVELLQRKIH